MSEPLAEAKDPEVWKDIPGFEGYYEVSDHGRVRSLDRRLASGVMRRGRILKPRYSRDYQWVILSIGGQTFNRYIHRLVLLAFVGVPSDGHQGCHYDGDASNNHISNLRWDTASANMRDNVRLGVHRLSRRTHCPRGHELVEPNLTADSRRRGHRACLACSRAIVRAWRKKEPLDKEWADATYLRIMEAAA